MVTTTAEASLLEVLLIASHPSCETKEGRAGNQRSYQSYQSPRLLSLYQVLESYQQKNITSTYSKKLLSLTAPRLGSERRSTMCV